MYVKPENVETPRAWWRLIDVLYDGGAGEDSLALGRWYDDKKREWSPVIVTRWNGEDGNSKGFPTSRGFPTWHVLPPHLYRAVLASEKIMQNKKALAEEVLHLTSR